MRKLTAALCLLMLSACEKNPVDKLANPIPSGAVPQSSGFFTIFDDELKTGGSVALLPDGANQSFDFRDRSAPNNGVNQIRYAWNGGDSNNQHLFAGFQLMHVESLSDFASTPARNLSAAGYTKLTLRLRGVIGVGYKVRIEGPTDGNGSTAARYEIDYTNLNNNYIVITLPIPTGDFAAIKSFITVTLQYTQPPRTTVPGDGGVIYLDDIKYEI